MEAQNFFKRIFGPVTPLHPSPEKVAWFKEIIEHHQRSRTFLASLRDRRRSMSRRHGSKQVERWKYWRYSYRDWVRDGGLWKAFGESV